MRRITASNILHYRHIAQLTQQQLADKLIVSVTVLQHWEKGRSFPSLDMLIKLVDVLQAGSIDDFCRQEVKNVDTAHINAKQFSKSVTLR